MKIPIMWAEPGDTQTIQDLMIDAERDELPGTYWKGWRWMDEVRKLTSVEGCYIEVLDELGIEE